MEARGGKIGMVSIGDKHVRPFSDFVKLPTQLRTHRPNTPSTHCLSAQLITPATKTHYPPVV
eukprot:6194166-Pleurochrysis_carterae.AAC.1